MDVQYARRRIKFAVSEIQEVIDEILLELSKNQAITDQSDEWHQPQRAMSDAIDCSERLNKCLDRFPYDPLIVLKTGMYIDSIHHICMSPGEEPKGELSFGYHTERLSSILEHDAFMTNLADTDIEKLQQIQSKFKP